MSTLNPIVESLAGPIVGRRIGGLSVFLGIPYATPPVGPLRFAAPVAAAAWTDPLDCVAFSAVAPQASSTMEMLLGGDKDPQSEDCLYLNVWTPDSCDPSTTGSRPVMVWIHGGAFTIGSARTPWYNGQRLSERGDAVVVTINYRLGVLGFLHIDEVPGSGNNGIRDQILALEWVQANIARFGGDASNVTIFGESAGAMSVGTLMAAGKPGQLFHKAILQSGGGHHVRSADFASEVTNAVLEGLGVSGGDVAGGDVAVGDLEKLRSLDVAAILAVQSDVESKMMAGDGLPFAPVVDGIVVHEMPITSIAAGSARAVAVMAGTTNEEMKLFLVAMPKAWTEPDVTLTKRFGADLVAAYVAMNPDRAPIDRGVAMVSDFTFVIPAVRLLEAQNSMGAPAAYRYRFDYASTAFGGLLGSCHALELPFVFDNMDSAGARTFAGEADGQDELAGAMAQAWVNFARTGNPNDDGEAQWAPYNDESLATMVFNNSGSAQAFNIDGAERAAWQGVR